MSKRRLTIEDVTPSLYESHITDRNGEETRTLYTKDSRREFVSYDEIPPDLIHATVAIEDKRFYRHNGIDLKGIARSAVGLVLSLGKKVEGGSTITQQLIKNMVFSGWVKEESLSHKFKRKVPELILSLKLEKMLTKEEILERYLNCIYFGGGCYGVQTASKYYFNKPVSELDIAECAMLVRIPNNPTLNNPMRDIKRAHRKKNVVARRMHNQGYITDEQLQIVLDTDFTDRMKQRAQELSVPEKYFSYHEDSLFRSLSHDLMEAKNLTKAEVINLLYSGGLNITTTQNTAVQSACDELFAGKVLAPDERIEAAMLLIDPMTGEVLAEEGGLGAKEASLIFSRAVDAKRNADSRPVKRYFHRTRYTPEKNTVSLKDLCLAYSYYDKGLAGGKLSYYKDVTDMNGNTLLRAKAPEHNPDPSGDPLPDIIELSADTDCWVIGRVGDLVLGVWCGYDNNRYIPADEDHFTFSRRIWDEVKTICKENQL